MESKKREVSYNGIVFCDFLFGALLYDAALFLLLCCIFVCYDVNVWVLGCEIVYFCLYVRNTRSNVIFSLIGIIREQRPDLLTQYGIIPTSLPYHDSLTQKVILFN